MVDTAEHDADATERGTDGTVAPIRRVVAILSPDDTVQAVDTITLDHHARTVRRRVLVGEGGTRVALDEPATVTLRPGALLALDGGSRLRVAAAREPCHRIKPGGGASLAELAWHLGNRHAMVEIVGETLRIARDPVLARMAEGMGATVREETAPFAPLRGAYHAHSHAHGTGE